MNRRHWITASTAAATALAVAGVGGWQTMSYGRTVAQAEVQDTEGTEIGELTILLDRRDGPARVMARFDLPPEQAGFHGLHIHAVGECVPPFTSAGGHLGEDPEDPDHRHRNHAGDLPVLLVQEDGRGTAYVETDRLTAANLLDEDGSAVILHSLPDNYANIPSRYDVADPVSVYPDTTTDETTLATGDAGSRLGCGVLAERSRFHWLPGR